ncbi:MAG: hypothetical protein V4722_12650 [Bacteroidota bacterium]
MNTPSSKKYLSLLFVFLSGIAAFAIAMANPKAGNMEMDALFLMYGPIASTASFLVLCFIGLLFKVNWKWLAVILSALNIGVGIWLYFFRP